MNNIKFAAKIVDKGTNSSGRFLILDHTEFCPDGKGGQLGDRGFIGNSNVIKVLESTDNIIFHYVDQYPDSDTVECKIDGVRRKDISIQHTAQHILSQSFLQLFNIETIGFHMGEDYTTVDLNIDKMNEDLIFKAEDLANEIVLENRLVKKYFVSESELQNLSIRKKGDIKGNIRIVEIKDFDLSMCGGTHVDSTGEIGLIKIIKQEKLKKIYTRFYFVAGLRALRNYRERARILSNISQLLTAGEEEIFYKLQNLIEENKALIKENRIQREKLFEHLVKDFVKRAEQIGKIKFVFEVLDDYSRDDISLLGKILSSEEKLVALILSRENNLFGALIAGIGVILDFDAIREGLNNFIMRSWGNKNFIFFEFKNEISTENINNLIKEQLKKSSLRII